MKKDEKKVVETVENPTVCIEPVIPEDPVSIAPVEEPGCEGTCACGNPNCNSECPSSSITIGSFFGTLQECVTITWRLHLKTRKHHIHVTLNEFYDKAIDIVDDIIEQYQGICGVVEEPFANCITGDGKTECEYLTELKAFVENNKCVLGSHSEIDSTIYKITSFCENEIKSFEEFVYEDYSAIKESCNHNKSCDDSNDEDYDPDFAEEE